ncbi:MAG TPA: glucosaminidase domain-containing protein [Ktedonobacteraceae bacterium]|nr:glucosaminidase domain-containing protein [Ktedonobacteraceae bacterium]
MASGSYSDYGAKKVILPEPEQMSIPLRARATQQLPALKEPEVKETRPLPIKRPPRVVNEFEEHPLTRHVPWLRTFYVSMIVIIIAAFVLISAGWFQRPGVPQLVISSNAQVFPIQVGGTLGAVNAWANSNGPADPKTPIPTNPGPYSVVGPNSLSVGFMNQVLAYYHSPAAGKAQALYDEGVKYGLDSAYALAFFMHESSFGTTGVARVTLSLSNMRCVPQFPCLNENGGYAIFKSWEQGFEEWFKLIRNLYVAIWGRVTVDQIIPKYAPNSDGNNEAGYIATLKHTISTWRAGIIPA